MSKRYSPGGGRRGFLKGAVALGGTAAVVVAGGAGVPGGAAPDEVRATPDAAPRGYRATAHVEQYYRLARR